MNILHFIQQRGDVFVAVCVVSILGVMMLPIPPFILDILLSLSISLSIVILITGINIKKPIDFSVFPSILLMTTLFRLSLNIASTRLVLLRGNEGIDAAGEVIKSFGSFIVGGNYAVGFTIFLILVVVNFVVITKGSGRIAEVAARFILDAMPGNRWRSMQTSMRVLSTIQRRERGVALLPRRPISMVQWTVQASLSGAMRWRGSSSRASTL